MTEQTEALIERKHPISLLNSEGFEAVQSSVASFCRNFRVRSPHTPMISSTLGERLDADRFSSTEYWTQMIREISARCLPIVLEESFANTYRFVEKLAPKAVIIIPHLGALNGSYPALERAGIWQRPNTYADTALAPIDHMRHFIQHYGPERLLFGSDFPFGAPSHELRKVQALNLPSADQDKILCGNILGLINNIR